MHIVQFESHFQPALKNLGYQDGININNILDKVGSDLTSMLFAKSIKEKLVQIAKILQSSYGISEEYTNDKVLSKNNLTFTSLILSVEIEISMN